VAVNPGLGTERPASEPSDQSTVERSHLAVNTASTQPVAKVGPLQTQTTYFLVNGFVTCIDGQMKMDKRMSWTVFLSLSHTHTHTHTHTYIQKTYIYSYIHAYIHLYIHNKYMHNTYM